jgi:hypothetical protein
MAAIRLVLQLDREAESVERAARAIEESEWTDEKEKLYERLSKSLQEGLASFEAREGPEEKKIPL